MYGGVVPEQRKQTQDVPLLLDSLPFLALYPVQHS